VRVFGDNAIPPAGRALSAVFTVAGVAALIALLRPLAGWGLAALLGLFAFTGPLVGWWSLTVRPDVAALAGEILGLALLLRAGSPARLVPVGVAALAFFTAWSFKQTYVGGLAAGVVWLLMQRRPRAAATLAGTFTVLATLVFLGAGPAYRAAQFHVAAVNEFHFAHGLDALRLMLAKTAPLWPLPLALLVRGRTWGRAAHARAPEAFLLAVLGLGLSLAGSTVLSCKLGASTNYFFSVLPFLALLNALAINAASSARPALVFVALALGLQGAVAAGGIGSIRLAPQVEQQAALWQEWQRYPEPRFSSVSAFNLPWLSPASPPIVTAFNYPLQRRAGVDFEGDGVGGMIRRREFSALLLPDTGQGTYDGAKLDGYVADRRMFGLVFYRRLEHP
jgi:hypothetical protein